MGTPEVGVPLLEIGALREMERVCQALGRLDEAEAYFYRSRALFGSVIHREAKAHTLLCS
jgi:hypothetical protein